MMKLAYEVNDSSVIGLLQHCSGDSCYTWTTKVLDLAAVPLCQIYTRPQCIACTHALSAI